jgi:hypothetical protein
MRRAAAAIVLALRLGACGSEAQPTAAAQAGDPQETSGNAASEPGLATCTAPKDIDEELGVRETGLPVPHAFAGVVRSNLYHFLVSTLNGGTLCVDTSWMFQIEEPTAEGRFLSFAWVGYEAFGHILVDRAGQGTVIDTGEAPAFSPNGEFVAGLQVSEAGWGGLEGFAIWRVTPTGLAKHFTLVTDKDGPLPEVFRGELAEWRIDNWVGEDCLAISAASWDALEAVGEDFENAARTPFHARRDDGWAVKPGPPDACSQA